MVNSIAKKHVKAAFTHTCQRSLRETEKGVGWNGNFRWASAITEDFFRRTIKNLVACATSWSLTLSPGPHDNGTFV